LTSFGEFLRFPGAQENGLFLIAEPQRLIADEPKSSSTEPGSDLFGCSGQRINAKRLIPIAKADTPTPCVCVGMKISYENICARFHNARQFAYQVPQFPDMSHSKRTNGQVETFGAKGKHFTTRVSKLAGNGVFLSGSSQHRW